jgi:hypothetical protein
MEQSIPAQVDTQSNMARIKIVNDQLLVNDQLHPIKDEWILVSKYNPSKKSWEIKTVDIEAIKEWLLVG